MQVLIIQSVSTHVLWEINQQAYHNDKFSDTLLNEFSSLIVIQLLQTLSVTFEDVKTLSVRVSFVISDQVALKDCSITLFEQLYRVLVLHKGIVFKIKRQKINQLQLITFLKSWKLKNKKKRRERKQYHSHCFITEVCYMIIAFVKLCCIFFELSFLRFCWSFNSSVSNMLKSILNSDSVSEASSVFLKYTFWILKKLMTHCNSTLQSVQSWLSKVNSTDSEEHSDR